ncbi:39S ribosomal protein L40, mitochondrial-like [Octopus sinensis]|uniref:Large ribosomal subunit protein mL40 n=1 Tax=Octopus sinensis TaxID=2607531 RepID=A0A6P7U6F2_9MOLL|nr:39S ribosomal protein L40, mitochondrial-like [Octopus sinensis]
MLLDETSGGVSTQLDAAYLDISNSKYPSSEPIKKKKRLDPEIQRERDIRTRKKLDREIRRLSRVTNQLKPIIEEQPDLKLISEIPLRKRLTDCSPDPDELQFETIVYSKLRRRDKKEQRDAFQRAVKCEKEALIELSKTCEWLYKNALKIDKSLIPLSVDGPSITPQIRDYSPLDGEYIETTNLFIDD